MLITQRRLFLGAALLLILAAGAFLRFHLPVWPFADGDTWGYINPAISKLSGGVFKHTQGRNFVYPAGVLLLLATTRTFATITVAQHLLGLATGGLLFLAWSEWRKLARQPRLPYFAHAILGLLLVASYVLSMRAVQFEHSLRPEAVTPFFAIFNIYLGLQFIQHWRLHSAHWKFVVLATALLLNSLLLAFLKTSFALSAIFALLPSLIWLGIADIPIWLRRVVFGGAAVFFVSLVAAEQIFARADNEARDFLPKSLFTIHANLITRQMGEDLANGDCALLGCDRLREIKASLDEEMARSWTHSQRYPGFGFDPDYLMYNDEVLRDWQDRFFEGHAERQLAFYRFYFRRMVRHHPRWMLKKTMEQLALFYGKQNPAFDCHLLGSISGVYQRSFKALTGYHDREEAVANYPAARDYLSHVAVLTKVTGMPSQFQFMGKWNKNVSYLFRPVSLVTVGACIFVFASARRRRRLGALAFGTILMHLYSFGSTLGVAVLHSMHIPRYSYAQNAFVLLSIFAGIGLIFECLSLLFEERHAVPIGMHAPNPADSVT